MPLFLGHKETAVLNHISKEGSISQRELSKLSGISLGLINVVLKRLIQNGYIRISQMNKRKLQYFLTPLGLSEIAQKTHREATSTIKNFKRMQVDLDNLLKGLHHSGYDYFSIYGDGDLRDLVESTFRTCLEEAPVTLGMGHRQDPRAVVLNVTPEPMDGGFKGDVINILEKIGWS